MSRHDAASGRRKAGRRPSRPSPEQEAGARGGGPPQRGVPTRGARLSLWAGIGIALAVPLVSSPLGFNPFGPPKALALALAALCAAFGLLLSPPPRPTWTRPLGLSLAGSLAAYLGVTALSVATSVDPLRSLTGSYPEYQGLAALVCYAIVGCAAARLWSADPAARTALPRAVTVVAVVVAAYAVAQRFGIDPLLGGVQAPVEELASVRSTLGNASNLGVYLVVVLPLAAWVLRRPGSVAWRVVGSLTLVLGTLALAWTNSRGAWLGAGTAAVVWLAFEARAADARRRRVLIVSAAAAAAAAAAAVALVPGLGGRVLAASVQSGSGAWRLKLWLATGRMIAARPFLGWGPDSFRLAYQTYRPADVQDSMTLGRVVADPHDALIASAAASGIIAALALGAAFVSGLGVLWTSPRETSGRTPQAQGLQNPVGPAIAVASALAGAATALAFHFITIDTGPYLGMLFGVTAAFALAAEAKPAAEETGHAWRLAARAVAGVAVVAALLLVAGASSIVAADAAQREAYESARAGWGVAGPKMEAAVALAPWEPTLRAAQARLAGQAMLQTADRAAYDAGTQAIAAGAALAPLDAGFLAERGVLELNAADAFKDSSHAEVSAEYFRKALARDPNNVAYRIGYGSALARYGELEGAITAFRRAIELAPLDRFLYKAIARVYDAAGMKAEAAAARERATALIQK